MNTEMETTDFTVPKLKDVPWRLLIKGSQNFFFYFRRLTYQGGTTVHYRFTMLTMDGKIFKWMESDIYTMIGNTYKYHPLINASTFFDESNKLYSKSKDILRMRFEAKFLVSTESIIGDGNVVDFDIPVCNFNDESVDLINKAKRFGNTLFRFNNSEVSLAAVPILAHKSEILDQLFLSNLPENMVEIAITDTNYDIFDKMINNVYKNGCDLPEGLEKKMFIAIVRYGFKDLKLRCEAEISKLITLENAIDWLNFAKANNATKLEEYILNFIKINTENMTSDQWFEIVSKINSTDSCDPRLRPLNKYPVST
jgi:hypothetical protein